jgi:hypothetical protein
MTHVVSRLTQQLKIFMAEDRLNRGAHSNCPMNSKRRIYGSLFVFFFNFGAKSVKLTPDDSSLITFVYDSLLSRKASLISFEAHFAATSDNSLHRLIRSCGELFGAETRKSVFISSTSIERRQNATLSVSLNRKRSVHTNTRMSRKMNISNNKITVLVVALLVVILALANAIVSANTVESKSPFKIVSLR